MGVCNVKVELLLTVTYSCFTFRMLAGLDIVNHFLRDDQKISQNVAHSSPLIVEGEEQPQEAIASDTKVIDYLLFTYVLFFFLFWFLVGGLNGHLGTHVGETSHKNSCQV